MFEHDVGRNSAPLPVVHALAVSALAGYPEKHCELVVATGGTYEADRFLRGHARL